MTPGKHLRSVYGMQASTYQPRRHRRIYSPFGSLEHTSAVPNKLRRSMAFRTLEDEHVDASAGSGACL